MHDMTNLADNCLQIRVGLMLPQILPQYTVIPTDQKSHWRTLREPPVAAPPLPAKECGLATMHFNCDFPSYVT